MEGVYLLFGLASPCCWSLHRCLLCIALARTSRLAGDLEQVRADIEVLERRLRGIVRERAAPERA